MKKQKKSIWQKISFALIVSFAFTCQVVAQSEIKFNALYNCPDSSMYNFKVLECNGKDCKVLFVNTYTPSASSESKVLRSNITDAFKTGGCTIDGKKLEAMKEQPKEENPVGNNQPQTPNSNQTQTGRFKVGERVLASPAALDEDEYYKKCTIIKDYMITEGADSYRVKCDDPKGGIGNEYNVGPKYIRVWANAEAPPATPDCQFNEPPGTASKTAKPSAETFKRVIFEQYRDNANGRKVGMTYQTFALGKSYVNRLTGNGLMHDGAPQGATIYTVKTKFTYCDKHTDSTIRWEYDAQYSCFKDKFGDWVCPSDATKISEPIYLPNK